MKVLQISLLILSLAAVLGVATPSAATCSNASLKGVFGSLMTGFDNPTEPGTSVGQATYDGNGNVSGSFTHSNGAINTVTFTGTYSVAKNCTGAVMLNKSGGGTEIHNFVIDDSKKGIQVIIAETGQIKTGFSLAQGTVTCGLTGKSQIFAVNLIGTSIGTGPVAYVGQAILDGNGTVSGSGTLSVDGNITPGAPAGTYTENANCTGTMQVTPFGGVLSTFYFVIVNAGKEVLMIETDTNTVISGTAQK